MHPQMCASTHARVSVNAVLDVKPKDTTEAKALSKEYSQRCSGGPI